MGFLITWGWEHNDCAFIFGWTISLSGRTLEKINIRCRFAWNTVALVIHLIISKFSMLSFCFCLWQLVCEVFLYYLNSLSGSLFCIIKSLCLQGFKTKDGYLVVAAGNDQQFMKVCKVSRDFLLWTQNMHINKSNQALFVHFSHSHIL